MRRAPGHRQRDAGLIPLLLPRERKTDQTVRLEREFASIVAQVNRPGAKGIGDFGEVIREDVGLLNRLVSERLALVTPQAEAGAAASTRSKALSLLIARTLSQPMMVAERPMPGRPHLIRVLRSSDVSHSKCAMPLRMLIC